MRKVWIGAALVLITTSSHADEVFRFAIRGGTARVAIPTHCRELSCLSLSFRDGNGKGFTTKDFKLSGSNETEAHPDAPPTSGIDGLRGPAANAAADNSSPTDAAGDGPATTSAPAADDGRRAPQRQAAEEPAAPGEAGTLGNRAPAMDGSAHSRETATVGAATAAPSTPTPVAKANSIEPGEWLVDDIGRARAAKAASRTTSTSPIGEWLIEDKTAEVRIEACGPNMCGYVSRTKNPNDTDKKNPDPTLRDRPIIGMKVLLDMKPSARGWDGNIYNAQDGSTYAAHMVMRSANMLRVEGCALGGLLCGGQNWNRID